MMGKRNPSPQDKFYRSYLWKRTSYRTRMQAGFRCVLCHALTPHDLQVHHRKPLAVAPALATEPANLMCVCIACHNTIEPKDKKKYSQSGCDVNGWPTNPDHPWNQGGAVLKKILSRLSSAAVPVKSVS